MSPITTHILDTGNGKPAADVLVTLELKKNGQYEVLGSALTDTDGRVKTLLKDNHSLEMGTYRIQFAIGDYYKNINQETFYPEASIVFKVEKIDEHYHVPLLLSGFGYSTYRGS